jgi:periplasmic divalent cation tolerance protein
MPPPDTEALRVVLCNAPEDAAGRIADALVLEGLAACVNLLGPVRSVYVWDGAVQHDTEVTLLVKTTAAAVAALTARIVALHPYKLPEVVAVPVAADEGHAPYLAWVAAQVRRS